MKIQKNGKVVFELHGKSLEAALQLELEIRRELETVPVKNAGPLNEIQDSWDRFYDGLIRRLRREAPEVLQQTGLESPAPQVFQQKGGMPRAYREYPAIFASPEKNARYFMYAPVDYRGNYFAPEDGVMLDAKKTAQADDLLFAGGWLGNAPLVGRKKEGATLPPDYKALKPQFDNAHTQVCFIAGGESLQAVEDFDRRTAAYHAAVDTVRKAIRQIVEAQYPDIMQGLPPAEGLRTNLSYRYGGGDGRTELLLSVRREGKTSLWDAGKTVPVPENPAYLLAPAHGGEYTVAPRRDTPEGLALAALFDAIPPTPSLKDYKILQGDFPFKPGQFDEMLGVNGVVPQARKLEGMVLLVYNAEEDAGSSFCPKGAAPLSTAAYLWLQADAADRNLGVTPPPMPQSVTDILDAAANKKNARQRPAGPQL